MRGTGPCSFVPHLQFRVLSAIFLADILLVCSRFYLSTTYPSHLPASCFTCSAPPHPPAPLAPSLSPAPETYHALCRTSQSTYPITHNRRHSKRGRPHHSMLRSSSSAAVPEAAIPPPHSLAKVMMLSFLRPQNSRGPPPHSGNPF